MHTQSKRDREKERGREKERRKERERVAGLLVM